MPLPLPVAPPSTPLTAGPARPASSAGSAAPQRPPTGSGVTVFDEQEYTWNPTDNFAKISQQYYGSDRFAQALQRHNQAHARASERMNRDGTPAPGERIYIPQSHILEQRYADVIAKPAPPAAPATVPTTFVPSSGAPSQAPAPMPKLTPTPAPLSSVAPSLPPG